MIFKLIDEIKKVDRISPHAADAYERANDRLIDFVNKELEGNPRLRELIGGNVVDVMRNNHRNHAAFMANVFKIGSYELLVRTIPWVYRAYRARGFSYEYFPVELTAWRQAVAECLDDSNSAEIIGVYNWMVDHHENMIKLSRNAEGLTFSIPGETTEMQEVILSLLLNADSRGCFQLVNQSVQTAEDLKQFYLHVVCPVMNMIGSLWERNEISVAEEHLASAIVTRIMSNLYQRFAKYDIFRGKAVITAAPNEFHELGARMMADFLEMDGWDVTYLGANTPEHEILKVLRKQKPFIVGLSAAMAFNLAKVRQTIEMIKGDREARAIKVIVGGLAFNSVPYLWRDIGADGYAADADKGASIAGKWWEGRTDVPASS
jgi:MerR family transcriptional regulator, light-induced transcriptional regulator